MRPIHNLRLAAIFLLLGLLAACPPPQHSTGENDRPTAQGGDIDIRPLPDVPPLPAPDSADGWRILACGYRNYATVPVPTAGARVGVGATYIDIRQGAAPAGLEIRLTESAERIEVGIDPIVGGLEPDTVGFSFLSPAELVMSFARCSQQEAPNNGQYAIYRYRRADNWVRLGGTVDTLSRTIRVPITELSRFAVATRLPADGQ